MQRCVLRFLGAFGLLFLVASSSSAQLHKDERLGFQIKLPRSWTQIPLQSDEKWIVAQFSGDKHERWVDEITGNTWRRLPTLRIVAFVDELIAPSEDDEGDTENEPGVAQGSISLYEFRDYEGFLSETLFGGHFIDDDKTIEHHDLSVRCLTVKTGDGSRGKDRILKTWVYSTGIGKIAIEFDVVQSHYKKKRSLIEKVLKSFKLIPRTKPLSAAFASSDYFSTMALAQLTPMEREAKKRELQAAKWSRMKADLVKGWEAYELDGALVLTRHDKKHAKSVVARVRAIMAWLDETFPTVGPDEYVRAPIVRICKNREEETRFSIGTGLNRFFGSLEITTHKDQSGASGFQWQVINNRAADIWFQEHDSSLYTTMPPWLKLGLEEVVESAKLSGSRLRFDRDYYELGFSDGGKPWGIERVMLLRRDEVSFGRNRPFVQAVALTRFFVSGAGSKGKFKGTLDRYLEHLAEIVDEIDAEEDEKAKSEGKNKAPTTEEEETELLGRRNSNRAKRENRILEEVYRRTFSGFSSSQMRALNKAYVREMK